MYSGGLRIRLINDNLISFVRDGLTDLGWFETDRHHKPVSVINEGLNWEEEAEPNIVAVTAEHVQEFEAEMGSNLADHTWQFYVDVYGESESVALHLATDIRDMLSGRMSSIGYTKPSLNVYDRTQATPPLIFTCDIEDIEMDKSRFEAKPFRYSWWVIAFTISDQYGDESD